jgi:hypothetical protein
VPPRSQPQSAPRRTEDRQTASCLPLATRRQLALQLQPRCPAAGVHRRGRPVVTCASPIAPVSGAPLQRSPGLPAQPGQACLPPARSPGRCTAPPRSHATPRAADRPARRPNGSCTGTAKTWSGPRSRSHSRSSQHDHTPHVSRPCTTWIGTARQVRPQKRDTWP